MSNTLSKRQIYRKRVKMSKCRRKPAAKCIKSCKYAKGIARSFCRNKHNNQSNSRICRGKSRSMCKVKSCKYANGSSRKYCRVRFNKSRKNK